MKNSLKTKIYNILLNIPETRDSRALLKWELMKEKGYIKNSEYGNEMIIMNKESFIMWENDTVRRCSQQLQREDLLLGKNLIQPTKEVKENRVKLSKSKGFEFQQGYTFDPITQTYK
jgi:ribosomal protein S8